ncbi:leukocyte immunoglobulin-like receptor subfamily B member 4 [Molossus nigricans]
MPPLDRALREGNQLHVRQQISDWVSLPGLSLDQRIHTQAGTLPKPTICAEPGSVVLSGSSVTLWCRGTTKAQKYCLYTDDMHTYSDRQTPLEPGDRAKFFLKRSYAGIYSCAYLSPTGWSERSDPLELVLTGDNVTLQCQSQNQKDTFLLVKRRATDPLPLPSLRLKYKAKQFRAEFSMSPVTSAHGGTCRCYSSLSTAPYLLSQPSEPLGAPYPVLSGSTSPWSCLFRV